MRDCMSSNLPITWYSQQILFKDDNTSPGVATECAVTLRRNAITSSLEGLPYKGVVRGATEGRLPLFLLYPSALSNIYFYAHWLTYKSKQKQNNLLHGLTSALRTIPKHPGPPWSACSQTPGPHQDCEAKTNFPTLLLRTCSTSVQNALSSHLDHTQTTGINSLEKALPSPQPRLS